MSRTLTSRGLAVVFALTVVLGVAPRTASARGRAEHVGRPRLQLTGSFTDPGAVLDGYAPTPYPTKVTVAMHGGTTTTGVFAGQSTYTLSGLADLATNETQGVVLETFTTTVARRGSGHVTLSERIRIRPDGTVTVAGPIIAGDGSFADARGYARFTGTTDPREPGPATGTYRMWIELAH